MNITTGHINTDFKFNGLQPNPSITLTMANENTNIDVPHYPLIINDTDGNPVLVWQSHPIQKIILNGNEITIGELVEKLKSLN